MERLVVAAVVVLLLGMPGVAGASGAAPPAGQTFEGAIVVSGKAGKRVVVSSIVAGSGVVTGVGRIVEVASRPGDPDNLDRDQIVFPDGRLNLVSVSKAPSFSLDPETCVYTATIRQRGSIEGGTGRYAHASGRSPQATVVARGVLGRNADGSCSTQKAPLFEVDTFSTRGTLSLD